VPDFGTPAGHPFPFDQIHEALARTEGYTVHPERIFWIAGAVSGVFPAGALAVKLFGEALARVRGLVDKRAVKRAGRLRSNPRFGVDAA
jgi:hypothetical protein